MSKVFIPVSNVGKAHDADIYSVKVLKGFTVTASGDGSLKFWSNKKIYQNDFKTLKDDVHVEFVDATGLHHVDCLTVNDMLGNDALTVNIISTVSFNGIIHFYQFVNENLSTLKKIKLLNPEEIKIHSFWSSLWVNGNNDQVVSDRLITSDIKGNTNIWKFELYKDETKTEIEPHLTYQGEISSNEPVVATCVDASAKRGLIATGFANGTVVVSQLSTLRPLYTFESNSSSTVNSVRSLKFSPLGNLLAVSNDFGSFGSITLYETEFGEKIGNLSIPTHSGQKLISGTTFAHNGWVFNLSFNSTGEFLATCGYDSKVRVWDIKLKERVSTLNLSANDIEIEDDIMLHDENGDSTKFPPIFDVKFINKGIINDTNEGLCCVCMDRSIRWFREAGGN
ncbi:hypothetical protein KAFR_0F04190 [Kazachstania africana CBS 2517]|uniref:Uncharacterized protein n=1 Tax=Kazachstania africana (strain ATCC 22294 / BCRC 22015 / CBS 2517 / CECT 1963 / NBRC 1671 / NRRL Y-8276) TaxID=1071382 RepID=H2AXB4_KAZAF|nr:hypothetical protein KAFR_0F04190 [Kazachstania africana CBS 2517]CCF59014.1 hypothetical protein KAFR_0F04190 [Kazachstania africana CBS 2517]